MKEEITSSTSTTEMETPTGLPGTTPTALLLRVPSTLVRLIADLKRKPSTSLLLTSSYTMVKPSQVYSSWILLKELPPDLMAAG
jgi:hypothetical protein